MRFIAVSRASSPLRSASFTAAITRSCSISIAGGSFVFSFVQAFLGFLHLLLHFLRLTHKLLHVGASTEAAEILSTHN